MVLCKFNQNEAAISSVSLESLRMGRDVEEKHRQFTLGFIVT